MFNKAKITASPASLFYFILVLSIGLILRIVLIQEKDVQLSWYDTGGFIADLAMAAIVAATLVIIQKFSYWTSFLLAVLWLIINFSYYEYVTVFDSIYALAHVGYLADPTFISGSAMTLSHPILFSTYILLLSITFWKQKQAPFKQANFSSMGALLLVLLLLSALWPMNKEILPWRQNNFIFANLLDDTIINNSSLVTEGPLSATAASLYQADLNGRWRFPSLAAEKKQNVLLVMVEGISGAYLSSIAQQHNVPSPIKMPYLDQIARDNISYSSFIAQQRQTNRGEYAVLCGDYPKLAAKAARMSEYVVNNSQRQCLPSILSQEGFYSAYLQAAPLAFMFKDQFMKNIGFDEVSGQTFFTRSYAKNAWGVDDKAFFEQSMLKIRQLNETRRPWFLTLMTVGTHHPYLVPDDFQPAHVNSEHERALAWTDESIKAFIENLQKEDVLQDTLVILTSDESAGLKTNVDDTTHLLSHNWAYLVVLNPKGHQQQIAEPYTLSDVGLSILDALELGDKAPHFVGRSVFRTYPDARPIIFSNVYFHKTFQWTTDGVLDICSENLSQCRTIKTRPERLFAPQRQPAESNPERIHLLREIVSRSLSSPLKTTTENVFPLLTKKEIALDSNAKQLVFGGQYLTINPASSIEIELEIALEGKNGVLVIEHDLISNNKNHYSMPGSMLYSGDKLRLHYTTTVEQLTENLETRLFVKKIQGEQLLLKLNKASMKIITHENLSAELPMHKTSAHKNPARKTPAYKTPAYKTIVHQFKHSRATSLNSILHLESKAFNTASCIQTLSSGVLKAQNCAHQYLLYGPYVPVAAGSSIKVMFDIEVTQGSTRLNADITSQLGKHIHTATKPVTLSKGQRKQIILQARLTQGTDLEGRLQSIPLGNSALKLLIHNAELIISAPQQQTNTGETD